MKSAIWTAGLLILSSSALGGEIRTSYGRSKAPSGPSRSLAPAAVAQAPQQTSGARPAAAPSVHGSSGRQGVSSRGFHAQRLGVRRGDSSPQTDSGPAPQFGALRMTGFLTKIGPENPQLLAVVDGGSDFMHPEGDKLQRISDFRGVHMGKADTTPSSGGGASGKNAITAIPNPGE